ncbi:hypothetical protein [Pontibacter harenae]|uniref:hypothetical protein n=1 Tax=Pontibacter harenae TaxID=2894083 RepID=UPI001E352514|nr:hypothetical protein [Pontibacter harenae]MCC9168925.1 hypothetical protein [Pontibacter harenae]
MASKKINFAALASGTALVTPMGTGKFMAYKKGNFKNQNVLVEHNLGKRKWYQEEELRLEDEDAAARERRRIAFAESFFAYDF